MKNYNFVWRSEQINKFCGWIDNETKYFTSPDPYLDKCVSCGIRSAIGAPYIPTDDLVSNPVDGYSVVEIGIELHGTQYYLCDVCLSCCIFALGNKIWFLTLIDSVKKDKEVGS